MIILTLALAGCAGSTTDPAASTAPPEPVILNVAAPTTLAAQWWEWHEVGESTSSESGPDGLETTSKLANETVRIEILVPGATADDWGLVLVERNSTGNNDRRLAAMSAGDVEPEDVVARIEENCEPEPGIICAAPVRASVRDNQWPLRARFPMVTGNAWLDPVRPIDWLAGASFAGHVEGPEMISVAGRSFDTALVIFDLRMDEAVFAQNMKREASPGAQWDADFVSQMKAWYSPEVGNYVRVESRTNITLHIWWPGGQDYRVSWNSTSFRELTSYGAAGPRNMGDLAAELGIEPRDLPPDYDPFDVSLVEIAIASHPERLNVSEEWTFAAHLSGPRSDEASVAWSLRRASGMIAPTFENLAQDAGPQTKVPFSEAGVYELVAEILKPDGSRSYKTASTRYFVDLRLASTASCGPAASPNPFGAADVCDGLPFRLLPGAYEIRGTSLFASSQAPCPYLAILKNGSPQQIVYAWPAGDVAVELEIWDSSILDLELRWFPTISTGETVDYTLDVIALDEPNYEQKPNDNC